VAVAAAVLIGALLVGDSVRASLREQALARVGGVGAALVAHERYVGSDLADRLASELQTDAVAPVLSSPGFASVPGRDGKAGIVSVYGVDDRFFALGPSGEGIAPGPDEALLSRGLAAQLGVAAGDTILVKVEKPSHLPRDMVMSDIDEVSVGMRATVVGVVLDENFGRFGLNATQVPPFNVFLPLTWMQQELDLEGRANMVLVGGDDAGLMSRADDALRKCWRISDAGLSVRQLEDGKIAELRSDRVFIEGAIVDAVRAKDVPLIGILTYFVNEIRAGDRATPYSMVTARGPLGSDVAGLDPIPVGGVFVNDWLADDLEVEVGDVLTFRYFQMGPGLKLEQRTSPPLEIKKVVGLEEMADGTLTPDLPGITDSENCRDWDPSVPVDLKKIRDHDETYWDNYGGAPKALVSPSFAHDHWENRFGTLTAIRGAPDAVVRVSDVARSVDPARLGFFFVDVRGPALAAGTSATDFSGLFIGLSLFLIVSALLLVALLFVFGVEQRSTEIGVLLAVGFSPKRVRRLFLGEALLLASVGTILGVGLGIGYTRGVLWGLGTLWRDAVGDTTLSLHASPTMLATGMLSAVFAAVAAIAIALRRAFKRPPLDLLNNRGPQSESLAPKGRTSLIMFIACTLGAVGLMLAMGADSTQSAMAFFGAGALLLVASLAVSRRLLTRLACGRGLELTSITALGVRNAGRRPGRSLATIALLASGTFLVVAVQANRLEPPQDPSARTSGTGGFTLFGRSTLPVARRLDTTAGRETYNLGANDLSGATIVSLRVREGDDASCLNLNLPQNPQLVGVNPRSLAGRFTFAEVENDAPDPWLLLDTNEAGVVPAIGDAASVTWSLHKKVGDTLDYRDDSGQPFKVRIVGTVANSILQGSLVVSTRHFERRFPSTSGFNMFLIEAPGSRSNEIAARLASPTSALADVGLELTSTADRLASFNAVQNTYLLIFQVLGGLGLLLGSVGLGMVVLRNALERRGELAITAAVGFPPRAVRMLVFGEHGLLLALGLLAGTATAMVAVLPSLGDAGPPVAPMLLLVAGVGASGILWTWLATVVATRGPLIAALRDE
jgi:ABC-type antimicrobial peptide transport system permease subunit